MIRRSVDPRFFVAALVALAACGSDQAAVQGAHEPSELAPITADQVLVVTADREVLVVDEAGAVVRRIGVVPSAEGSEVNAVDVSADGSQALISVVNDHDGACSARVFEVGDDGLRQVYDGAGAVFDRTGTRIAHVTYVDRGEFCYRSGITVRSMTGEVEASSEIPAGETLEDTPPLWPVNWSPDGRRLVLLAQAAGPAGRSTRIVDVKGDGALADSREISPAGSFFSPVFLTDRIVIGSSPCCIRPQLVSLNLPDGRIRVLADLPGPVRSIRPDRGGPGMWLVLEEAGLYRWDGTRLHAVAIEGRRVELSSG